MRSAAYYNLGSTFYGEADARAGEDDLVLDATQLTMLLDGIDVSRVERPKHWRPRAA